MAQWLAKCVIIVVMCLLEKASNGNSNDNV
jgi:hypothetical protein